MSPCLLEGGLALLICIQCVFHDNANGMVLCVGELIAVRFNQFLLNISINHLI